MLESALFKTHDVIDNGSCDIDLMNRVDNFSKIRGVDATLVQGNPNQCPEPFISIVIPTYKQPGFLRIALDSVLDQRNPGCTFEVVVVDNERTEQKPSETEKLMKQYNDPRLLYYQNENIDGMVGNWNQCILLARGEWVAFHHHDDILVSDYINRILGLISKRKDIAGIISSYYFFERESDIDRIKARIVTSARMKISEKLNRGKLMRLYQTDSNFTLYDMYEAPSCGSIFRKYCLLESGGFNDDFYPSHDWFFLYKYCREHRLYKSMEKLGYYRIVKNTSSLNVTKEEFIRDRILFSRFVSQRTIIGRVMQCFFYNEQNKNILCPVYSDHSSRVASGYFEPNEIRERRIRWYLYNALLSGYRMFKIRFFQLVG